MPAFSNESLVKLATCHNDLQRLFKEVVKVFDCTILEGHRAQERQLELFSTGATKTMQSKHLSLPSLAVDVTPFPVDFNDTARHYFFAGYVLAIAQQLGILIRWGGDWNGNLQVKDNSFNDLVHFELKNG